MCFNACLCSLYYAHFIKLPLFRYVKNCVSVQIVWLNLSYFDSAHFFEDKISFYNQNVDIRASRQCKGCQTCVKRFSKNLRGGFNGCPTGGSDITSVHFFITNSLLTPTFYRIGLRFYLDFHRIFPEADPKPARRKFKQCWAKCRNWSGIG